MQVESDDFPIKIADAKALLDQIKDLVVVWKHGKKELGIPASDRAISHLSIWAKRLETEYINLDNLSSAFIKSRLHHSARTKRSPFDFVGNLASSLFGTATQDQIEEIHSNIDNLSALSKKQLDQLNVHTTIINETVRNVNMMQVDLKQLTNTVSLLLNATIYNENDAWITMIATCQDLIWALNTIHANFLTMVLGVNEFMNGYPSSHLISDYVFTDLLNIAGKKGNGLIFPAQPNNLILYRSISSISPKYRKDGSIIFYLSIPLSDAVYGPFELYKIGRLPIPIFNTSKFISYTSTNSYLAVSHDNRRFMLLKDLADCTTLSSLAICNPSQPIYSTGAPNCEYAVFQGDEEDTCGKQIFSSFTPEFIKARGGYYFATPTPLKLHVRCPATRYSKTVAGTGFLEIPDTCEVHSDMLSLPAHTTIRGKQITIHTSLGNASYTLPKPIQRITKAFKNYGKELSDAITQDSPMDADLAVTKLKILHDNQNTLKRWISPSAVMNYGLVAAISAAALGTFIWFRRPNKNRMRPHPQLQADNVPLLRRDEIMSALIQLRHMEQQGLPA